MLVKRLLFVTLSAYSAIASAHVVSEVDTSKVMHINEVTVEAERRQVTASTPLQVVGREKWASMGISDLSDVIHHMSGVSLRDYGGAGGLKTVSVRGNGAKYTGVSYDGILLSECQSGEIDVSRYALDNVESIALQIGDQDGLLIPARMSAYPAVLSINTMRLPDSDNYAHVTSQLKFGSFGYISPFIKYEHNLSEKFGISILGDYVYAENNYPFTLRNITVVTKEHRTNSRMNSGHGEANFFWRSTDRSSLWGKLYYYNNARQLPGQVRYYTNLNDERLQDENAMAQMGYRTRSNNDKWSLLMNAKFNWSAQKYYNGSAAIDDSKYWQREYYFSGALMYRIADNWLADYSADYSFNNLSSDQRGNVRPYRNTILQSLSTKYENGRFKALMRILYSMYLNAAKDGRGAKNMNKLSPSLSLSYRLLDKQLLFLRASYKNIFRAPNFNESYYFHFGSVTLEPESTDQYNIGLAWQKRYGKTDIQLTVDGYLNHIKDKIVAVPYNMFVWTNINLGKVLTRGVDVTLNADRQLAKRHKLTFDGNYSYQRAENRSVKNSPYYKNIIAYQPVHTGSIALAYENPWVNIGINGNGMSGRWATNEHYDETYVGGYWEMGATLWRDFKWKGQSLRIKGDLKNMLDEQYSIISHYPMPGISYQIAITYKF